MVLTHVVVGNVDIRVANAAILQLKCHIIVPRCVTLDGDGGKGGALGSPSPGLGLIQLNSHLDRSNTHSCYRDRGQRGRPWLLLLPRPLYRIAHQPSRQELHSCYRDGGKGGALGSPSPGLGLIQLTSHLDRRYTAVTEMGEMGAPLAALAQAFVLYSSLAI
jgi:hypothetical protein